MVVSDVFDPALRRRSFEIIAEVAGLRATGTNQPAAVGTTV
jgi:hypothetical protein